MRTCSLECVRRYPAWRSRATSSSASAARPRSRSSGRCGLVERARFKNSFIFKYSPRRGTKADELFPDDVPEEVKKRRNNDLLAVQTAISLQDNREFIGREVTVLVEGPKPIHDPA